MMKKVFAVITVLVLLCSCSISKPVEQVFEENEDALETSEGNHIENEPEKEPEPEPAIILNENLHAIVTSDEKNFPSGEGLPQEIAWATEEDAEKCLAIIENLNPEEYSEICLLSVPNDELLTVELSEESAVCFFELFRQIKPVACEPKNPCTGGSLSIFLSGEKQKIAISYPGEIFIIRIEGEETGYIFDAKSCESILNDLSGFTWNLLYE